MINRIYLHWTAGRYDQLFNDYHICIDGDGVVHKMADFETKLAHTWQRNSNAVGIALCCCYGASITLQSRQGRASSPRQGSHEPSLTREGEPAKLGEGLIINWGLFPPKEIQIVSMARCVAEICKEYGLPIRRDTVMTHAEVADVDGYGVFDDDPDMRWDLFSLPFSDGLSGGDYVRCLAKQMANAS